MNTNRTAAPAHEPEQRDIVWSIPQNMEVCHGVSTVPKCSCNIQIAWLAEQTRHVILRRWWYMMVPNFSTTLNYITGHSKSIQILGISRNSRKWPCFCAKRCQIDQTSLFDSISLKFIQSQWVVDVAGYKVSAWHVVLFLVFDVKKLPQKSVKLPQKTSNSRKSRKVIQTNFLEPTWSHHWLQTVWQMQGHWEIRCNSWNSELY